MLLTCQWTLPQCSDLPYSPPANEFHGNTAVSWLELIGGTGADFGFLAGGTDRVRPLLSSVHHLPFIRLYGIALAPDPTLQLLSMVIARCRPRCGDRAKEASRRVVIDNVVVVRASPLSSLQPSLTSLTSYVSPSTPRRRTAVVIAVVVTVAVVVVATV